MTSFRKSNMYNGCIQFLLFCLLHDIDDVGLYYGYLNEIRSMKYPNLIFSKGVDEAYLRDYRIFLQRNPRLIDSARFYEVNEDIIDDEFLVRSLEKSHIALDFVSKNDKLCNMVEHLPIGLMQRFISLLDKVEKR